MNLTTADAVATGLRAWAKGIYPTEAAVELLIRTNKAREGHPWVFKCDPPHGDETQMYGIDFSAFADNVGTASGGERRLLLIAASLGGADNFNDPLYELIPGLDRHYLTLVLAAIAHAGGSHEHKVMGTIKTQHGEVPWPTNELAGSLFPWPEAE